MNFLQLAQRACVECGVASNQAITTALPTVVGATGSTGRVVNWINDAEDIVTWENNAHDVVEWSGAGYVMNLQDGSEFGKYIGLSMSSNDVGGTVNSMALKYVWRQQW